MAAESTEEESSILASDYYTHFRKASFVEFRKMTWVTTEKNEMTCVFGMTKGVEAEVAVRPFSV
jgi:hypothetical protein